MDVWARCLGCGAEIQADTLKGAKFVDDGPTDRDGIAMTVSAPGMCLTCGGGKFSVSADFTM